MFDKMPSSNDPVGLMNFHCNRMNSGNNKSMLFQKTESDALKECLWDKMQHSDSLGNNLFVEGAELDDDEFIGGRISKEPSIIKKFEFKKPSILIPLNKDTSTVRVGNVTPPPEKCSPTEKKVKASENKCRKSTMDVSDEAKSSSSSFKSEEYTPSPRQPKRRKRRRDVIFKTILRECRRYFQIQLSNLTGFITSKKPRNDDYMYMCMKKFNIEELKMEGTFEENFYLACLLYPQDLTRSIDSFLVQKDKDDIENLRKEYKKSAQRIHDTLYKYSHDKLDYFASKKELSFLFCYFYEKGAGPDKENPKYIEEYEFIRNKCMDSLNNIASNSRSSY